MSEPAVPVVEPAIRRRAGCLAAFGVGAIYLAIAFSVDFPTTAVGIQSDEATYYMMGHSLAADGDLAYRREDLERVWKEFPSGPSGLFLKKGQEPSGIRLAAQPPFFLITGRPDSDRTRLFYAKSFIYPALAAPLVRWLGTNGFLVFNALLLVAGFLAAYVFLSARSPVGVSLLLAGAFVFASVVPVYFVWITPELFNFTVGLLAYFFWLYKFADGSPGTTGGGWLRGTASDYVSAALVGIATFSKVTGVLLLVPLVAWWAWTRQWRKAVVTVAIWAAVTGVLFGINVAVTGDWNYQGGERKTFYGVFPFQSDDKSFENTGDLRARNEGREDVIFDRQMFWTNLTANLKYFFVGRYSGLVAYFFPAVFGMLALLLAGRRSTRWQWLVLAGILIQILAFVVSQPYTYFGGGGSVGNRYFMAAYGLCVFLLPPLRSSLWAAVPWIVGSLFMAKLVLNPFYTSILPAEHAKAGPLRLLPVELTNVNDLPTNTNRDEMLFWFTNEEVGHPGFQIYYLDDNAFLKEIDNSFWVRGDSRAELLLKTDQPFRRLQLTLGGGPVPTTATVRLRRQSQAFSLPPDGKQQITLELGPGFPYKKDRPDPAYVWVLSISSGPGFVPLLRDPTATDSRYLGVRVWPSMIR